MIHDHECSGVAEEEQEYSGVAVEAVEEEEVVADDGYELESGQEAPWENTDEVEDDADAFAATSVVIPFTRNCVLVEFS